MDVIKAIRSSLTCFGDCRSQLGAMKVCWGFCRPNTPTHTAPQALDILIKRCFFLVLEVA